jgi:hypothetical protein
MLAYAVPQIMDLAHLGGLQPSVRPPAPRSGSDKTSLLAAL